MDLREIIRWFIPCFHILLMKFHKMDTRLTFVCLFLFFNCCPTFGAKVSYVKEVGLSQKSLDDTKNVNNLVNAFEISNVNQSDVGGGLSEENNAHLFADADTSVGRTFGRPFKKMMAGLLPLVFQIGAASTFAVIAAVVGVKTLAVTLLILKLLLVAGAAKVGALFASKSHHQKPSWEPHPQKEIHLHIHNGGQPPIHEEHINTWNRNELLNKNEVQPNHRLDQHLVFNPYSGGPQTISTPYGNYVKVE